MSKENDSDITDSPIEISQETSTGEIRISHTVIQHIVRLAAMSVTGVLQVGSGGFVDEIAGIFTKKESSRDISVEEDEHGEYRIRVHVVLAFGIQLAKCADEIQTAVREQVLNMTNKHVARVDVFIDGIKEPETDRPERSKSRSRANARSSVASSETQNEG